MYSISFECIGPARFSLVLFDFFVPSIAAAVVSVVHMDDDIWIMLQMNARLVTVFYQAVELKNPPIR